MANILELDGFQTGAFTSEFTRESLKQCNILVIANAIPESSVEKWEAPTASAFSPDEIRALEKWVRKGGKLFLIADHMPFGGAAKDLAAAFGFTFYDSFAGNEKTQSNTELFLKSDGSLSKNILTERSDRFFEADSVATFTGQVFEIPDDAHSILNCGEGWISLLPEIAWQFEEDTEKLDSEGWSQGAYMEYGKGRLVVFGEAAMFSAQIAELPDRSFNAGMNHPTRGNHNYKLLLNIIRWLDSGE
jgi:hypothetical protein